MHCSATAVKMELYIGSNSKHGEVGNNRSRNAILLTVDRQAERRAGNVDFLLKIVAVFGEPGLLMTAARAEGVRHTG